MSNSQQDIKSYLEFRGYFVWKANAFNKRGYRIKAGVSDLIAVGYGHVLFVECKSGSDVQKPKQAEFEADIKNHGGHYILAYNFKDVSDYLHKYGLL
jgi:Holliday junction resolvase